MEYEIIDASEVVAVRRGRKASYPAELLELFQTLGKGKVARLTAYKGDPSNADAFRKHKASTGAMLRGCAKSAGRKASIAWSPDGVPQVTLTK